MGDVDRVSVRPLVRYPAEVGEGDSEAPPKYTTFTGGRLVELTPGTEILGFAELPPNATVGTFWNAERFERHVEVLASYVHWKDGGPSADRGGGR